MSANWVNNFAPVMDNLTVSMNNSSNIDELFTRNKKQDDKNSTLANSSENQLAKEVKVTHLQNLEEELQRRLRTRVEIKYREGKGQIKIDYFSLEEFERLYDLLTSS